MHVSERQVTDNLGSLYLYNQVPVVPSLNLKLHMLSAGTMLVGCHCLQSIANPRFLEIHWLSLLTVNGFGIATG